MRHVYVEVLIERTVRIKVPLEEGVPSPPTFDCGLYVSSYIDNCKDEDMKVVKEVVQQWSYSNIVDYERGRNEV